VITISGLGDVPAGRRTQIIDRLVEWHVGEWGPLYNDDVWNVDIARRELDEMVALSTVDSASIPQTWVALDEGDELIGSVSLLITDDLAGWEHVTPWLASLYVDPAHRSLRIGAVLVHHVLDAAARLGHPYVHLFTSGQERYYLERGWRTLTHTTVGGHDAAVMAKGTSPRAARRSVTTRWCTDPAWGGGAYSYLRVGGTPDHRRRLAERIRPGLWFAGEWVSTVGPGTMHGAWFAGAAAAEHVLTDGASSVVVVGAGLAGLSRCGAGGHRSTRRPGALRSHARRAGASRRRLDPRPRGASAHPVGDTHRRHLVGRRAHLRRGNGRAGGCPRCAAR
jgi:predicted N-acetyltransferase YhbS